MQDIDRVISRVPILLNDLFRHLRRRGVFRVFLCGREPEDRRFDLRLQVQSALSGRMGCTAFLGEEIDELNQPRADRNHLSIEVREAARSHLVLMFLGSPGTIAELTAFAMDKDTNPKLVVFNDARYRGVRSFINLGPLKLVPQDRVIYYDSSSPGPSLELVRQLDRAVARARFELHGNTRAFGPQIPFEAFVALALIYAAYPVRYADLTELLDFDDRVLRDSLRELFDNELVEEQENRYMPRKPLEEACTDAGCERDISRARVLVMERRLKTADALADYRLLL